MKKITIGFVLMAGALFATEIQVKDFDTYLKNFDLKERNEMKISSVEMLNLVEENRAVVIDIRFSEEYEAWHMPFMKSIPLNELPKRLGELPRDKLIITACPHNDRANLARIYLIMKGYNARYLSDGLLKTADYLRGDNAVEFIKSINKK